MDNAVALAAITLAGTITAGFFKLLNKLTKSIDNLVASNKEIARATKKGADEAKERNGHLAELIIQHGSKDK